MSDGLVFSATTLVAAVALFIASIFMRAAAISNTRRKTRRIKEAVRRLESECGALSAQIAEVKGEARVVEAEEKALGTENTQLRKACAQASMDTFEIVHEVGTPAGGNFRFDVEILLSPAALVESTASVQMDPRIWHLRNVAHIWSVSPADALQMAGRVFPARYGFVVTRFLNADMPEIKLA